VLPREVRAWEDVATARAAAVPLREPALPGKPALADLAFTTPVEAHHVGEPCDPESPEFNEWLMNVKNTGSGLAPKRYELLLSNGALQTVGARAAACTTR
jgi:hypothetical protein